MWLWVCILRLGQKHQVSSFAKVMMFSKNGAHGSSLAPSEAIFKGRIGFFQRSRLE
jgi:hypothetical protein